MYIFRSKVKFFSRPLKSRNWKWRLVLPQSKIMENHRNEKEKEKESEETRRIRNVNWIIMDIGCDKRFNTRVNRIKNNWYHFEFLQIALKDLACSAYSDIVRFNSKSFPILRKLNKNRKVSTQLRQFDWNLFTNSPPQIHWFNAILSKDMRPNYSVLWNCTHHPKSYPTKCCWHT